MTHEFVSFPKIPRWKREVLISEKIDGTNAQIFIPEDGGPTLYGSRNRWITPEQDNAGFARWATEHEEELRAGLGFGRHFGEWYGAGIQRRYGLTEKRFALFNTGRWSNARPACCEVVPLLYAGIMNETEIDRVMEDLRVNGSRAVPGFMKPEGIVIYHCASGSLFKRTLEQDEKAKGEAA